jgi:hypothetical protein
LFYLLENMSPFQCRPATFPRTVASRSSSAVRIGFKVSRTGGLRECHDRHRVGFRSFKAALKDDYEGV